MQFINYFLASFLSWLGIAAGIILLKIAPEEKKPLSGVFKFVSNASVGLFFLFNIFYNYNEFLEITALIIYVIFLAFASRKIGKLKSLMINYLMLGFVFYLSMENINLFMINSCLIFTFGASAASQLYEPRKKNYSFAAYSLIFIAISNFMFLIK